MKFPPKCIVKADEYTFNRKGSFSFNHTVLRMAKIEFWPF